MPHTFRHPRVWTQGRLYRAPDNGEWVVQAIFEGPTIVFMDGRKFYRPAGGLLHLANYSLGVRLVAWPDEPDLRKLLAV